MASGVKAGSKQISNTGKRAFLLPLIICLFTLLPVLKQGVEWLDFMFPDFLFSYSPHLRSALGRPQMPQHPVLIVNKDATFAQRFGRNPDRSDFADLLSLLNDSKTSVVAFDFIYDSPSDEDTDRRFSSALASTAFPILAQHFVSRGRQTFEQVDLIDENALRPPWPKPLYAPIARNAATTGLINIASDLDSTIRYLPLAFHPADTDEFVLTLGYATWISSLIAEQSNAIIESAASSKSITADKLLEEIMAKSPLTYKSTGHAGIDQATRRLEAVIITRILKNIRPEQAKDLDQQAKLIDISRFGCHSWLKMPSSPLPLLGSYQIPCLRPFFTKQAAPLTGDGIKTSSMGLLLETDADRSSPFLDHKLMLNVNADGVYSIDAPARIEGTSSVSGHAVFADMKPVAGASVLLLSLNTETWQQSETDKDGRFSFLRQPAGDFILYLNYSSKNGWQKGTIRSTIDENENIELPELILAPMNSQVQLVSAATVSGKAAVFGEPLPLLRSDQNGHIGIDRIPSGFELLSLNENQNINFVDGNIMLDNGEPAAENVAALLPKESQWLLRFYHEQPLASGQAIIFANLPTSLDARLAILSLGGQSAQTTSDFSIMPDNSEPEIELPAPSQLATATFNLSFVGAINSPQSINITLLGETGKSYRFAAGAKTAVEAGRYLVLLEQGKARSFWANGNITAKTVFVGTSLAEDQDFVTTPIKFMDFGISRVPGVNLHATLFSALKRQSFLTPVFFHSDVLPRFWPFVQFILLLPLLVMLNLVFVRFGAMHGGICVIASSIIWLTVATHFFLDQILLPFFYPLLLLGSFGAVRGYIAWAISRQQEQQTRQTFGRFISAAVVDEILRTPGGLKTSSTKKELSVIFTDLAGFTTISEKLSPEQLTELMNEYLDEMTRILFKYGGTLDKYIGDAIMGFWNHPQSQPDHAQRATECAIAMQAKLAELREEWLQKGLPRVEVRAGINTAVCMVGFIGSEIQMNFTCLGDGVNLASRLEGANKAYGTLSMVSESVHNRIDRELISTRFLDYLAVKGKEKPIEVFEVRGYRRDESPAWLEAEPLYKDAIEDYLARNWDSAITRFESVSKLCPTDGPAGIYIERCRQFKKTPPPDNWDGSYSLKTK